MIIFNSNENWHGDWGPFSFPLSHLLKLGGSFETTCGHLTRTVPGSTTALEGGESQQHALHASVLSGLSSLAPLVGKVAFFFYPSLLNENPFAPFCKCMLPWPGVDRLACLLDANTLLIYNDGEGAAES